jgi:Protein of unknown function (DUF983)
MVTHHDCTVPALSLSSTSQIYKFIPLNSNKYLIFARIKLRKMKGYKIYAIIAMKCPQCHEGNQFKTPLLGGKVYDMYERCPVCQQKYEPEPGFYYGAMFIGYALSAFVLLLTGFLCLAVFKMTLGQSYFAMLLAMFAFFFSNARLSRSIWLNLMVDYKGK